MASLRTVSLVALCVAPFTACTKAAPPAADTTAVASAPASTVAADDSAVRAINPAWFKAYNAYDADAITALYADDAILSTPGQPPTKGTAAIRAAYAKELKGAAAADISNNSGPDAVFGVSGDLAHEWNTYTATDKSGKVLDKGKYLTVFERKNGKWMIVRDIWNSDTPLPNG